MLTADLLRLLKKFPSFFLASEEVATAIDEWSQKYDILQRIYLQIADAPSNQMGSRVGELQAALREVEKQIIRVRPMAVYQAIQNLNFDVSGLLDNLDNRMEATLPTVQAAVAAFGRAYDELLQTRKGSGVVKTVEASAQLRIVLAATADIRDQIIANLDRPTDEGCDDLGGLELVLGRNRDVAGVISALEAIQDLYAAVAELSGVSVADYPLRIRRLEAGSLFSDLLGCKPVMEAVARIITGGASFFHYKSTVDGQLSRLPRRFHELDALLELRQKLSESGLDVSAVDDNLERSAAIISARLTTLLESESTVRVNGSMIGQGVHGVSELPGGGLNRALPPSDS